MLADLLTKPLNGPKYKCFNEVFRNKKQIESNVFREKLDGLYIGITEMDNQDVLVQNMLMATLTKHR